MSGDGRSTFAIRERRGHYERLAAAAGRWRVAVFDRAQ